VANPYHSTCPIVIRPLALQTRLHDAPAEHAEALLAATEAPGSA